MSASQLGSKIERSKRHLKADWSSGALMDLKFFVPVKRGVLCIARASDKQMFWNIPCSK